VVRGTPERACAGATDRGAATGTTGAAFGAGVRIMPMTLGAEAGTATGGRAAAGAALATGAEFNAAGWPIEVAGLATGTFFGIGAGTSAAARAGLGVAAWIVGTFRTGTSICAECTTGSVGTLRGGAPDACFAVGTTGGGGPAACWACAAAAATARSRNFLPGASPAQAPG
jgi:hypothetical protein